MAKDIFSDEAGMSPRKSMASGDGDMGDFGCEKHGAYNKQNPEMKTDLHKRTLKDDDRAGGKPISHTAGKFPAQKNIDHGRHDAAHGPEFGRGDFNVMKIPN